jgi:hypothetical protein
MILKFEIIKNGNSDSCYFLTENNIKEEYEQRLKISEGELILWNCTCVFGSTFRFSDENRLNDTKCRHVKDCIRALKTMGYLKYGN